MQKQALYRSKDKMICLSSFSHNNAHKQSIFALFHSPLSTPLLIHNSIPPSVLYPSISMPFLLLFIPCLLLHFLAHFTIPFHFFSIDSLPYSRHSPPSVRPTSTTTQSSPTSVLPYYSLSLLSSSMSNLHLSISPPIPKARNAKRTPVSTGNSHSLRQFIRNKTINNTVLVMVVDFGYLKVFLNSYFTSRLWEYPNLVVLCFDKRSFLVPFRSCISCIDLEQSSISSVL